MNGEKTTLPSLRNIEWRTVKTETNKINQVLPYISTNRIKWTNLCRGEISLWENWDPLKKHEEKIKTRRGNSTRNTDKNLRKQAKMIKQRKNAETCRDKKEKTKIKIQLEKIKNNNTTWGNKAESIDKRRKIKEILTKGRTLQTKQDIPKTTKENSINNREEMTRKHNNRMQKKPNDFGLKYGNRKNIMKKPNG